MATFPEPEPSDLQQYSKELDSYEILAGRILDKVLSMRGKFLLNIKILILNR